MGIIGFGQIGQVTGCIAKALGMKVIVNDKNKKGNGKDEIPKAKRFLNGQRSLSKANIQ